VLPKLLGRSRRKASAYAVDGFTPLHLAAFFGRAEAAAVLVDRGADLDARSKNRRFHGITPLQSAIAGRQTALALLLLERGADPNAVAPGGWVPLHWAASSGDVEVCRALLKRKAKRMAMADDRTRPLDLAIENRHDEVVKLLKGGR
jgi:ankyrin repeat protein